MQKTLFYNDPLQTQGGIIMRGVETRIQEIRHKIFTEVARMAYHTEWPVKEPSKRVTAFARYDERKQGITALTES